MRRDVFRFGNFAGVIDVSSRQIEGDVFGRFSESGGTDGTETLVRNFGDSDGRGLDGSGCHGRDADGALLDAVATPEPAGLALLQRAAERLRLSARGYHRVLRVARTLADLDGAATVARRHVAEALSYRRSFDLPRGAGGS